MRVSSPILRALGLAAGLLTTACGGSNNNNNNADTGQADTTVSDTTAPADTASPNDTALPDTEAPDDTTVTTDTTVPTDTTVTTDTVGPSDTTTPNDTTTGDTTAPTGACIDDPFFSPGWENVMAECRFKASSQSDPVAAAETCLTDAGMSSGCFQCHLTAFVCDGACDAGICTSQPDSGECNLCKRGCRDDLNACAGRDVSYDPFDNCAVIGQESHCSEGALISCDPASGSFDFTVTECDAAVDGVDASCIADFGCATLPGDPCFDYGGTGTTTCADPLSGFTACVLDPVTETSACDGSGQTFGGGAVNTCFNPGDRGTCSVVQGRSLYCADPSSDSYRVLDCGPDTAATDVCLASLGCQRLDGLCNEAFGALCANGQVCIDGDCEANSFANTGFEAPTYVSGGGSHYAPTDWSVLHGQPDAPASPAAGNLVEVRTGAALSTVPVPAHERKQFAYGAVNVAGTVRLQSTTSVAANTGDQFVIEAWLLDAQSCAWTDGGPELQILDQNGVAFSSVVPIDTVGDNGFTRHSATWTAQQDGLTLSYGLALTGDTPPNGTGGCKVRLAIDRLVLRKL